MVSIEAVIGSNFADNLTGGAGVDTLYGMEGNDILLGNAGNDTLAGFGGDDTMNGGTGADYLIGGGGNDTFQFAAGGGQDIIHDLASGDVVQISGYTSAQSVTQAGADVILILSSTDQITFKNSTVSAVQGAILWDTNTAPIIGTEGNDILTGGPGADDLRGLGGNDVLEGGPGNDSIDGGAGIDFAVYDSATAGVSVNLAVSGPQNTGGAGIDTLVSIEAVRGSAFVDNLTGGSGVDTLYGMDGNDILLGGAGNDTLGGFANDDTINGGTGADYLIGGTGNDTFQFAAGDGQDVVHDLASGDIVRISGYSSAQSVTQAGADVVLTLSGTDQITFKNSTVAAVQASIQWVSSATTAMAVAAAGIAVLDLGGAKSVTDDAGTSAVASSGFDGMTQNAALASKALDDGHDAVSASVLTPLASGLPLVHAFETSALHAAAHSQALAALDQSPALAPAQLLGGTDTPAHSATSGALVADGVAMPSAEQLQAVIGFAEAGEHSQLVSRVLADALAGGEAAGAIDALLDAVAAHSGAATGVEHLAQVAASVDTGHGAFTAVAWFHAGFAVEAFGPAAEAMAAHPDAVPQA